jgi:hypothetical protein
MNDFGAAKCCVATSDSMHGVLVQASGYAPTVLFALQISAFG